MKSTATRIRDWLFGKPLDPFSKETRQHIALATFFAWVGLGADGISSSCYGPEEAFVALAGHTSLAIFLAIATAVTVFVIAIAYLQIIELFPNGGGSYRVTTTLLGPKAGLVSGSALIVDYILTIAISVASGADAIYSVMPLEWQASKLPTEFAMVAILTYLNLRGMKESIKILMPIFLGFLITHVAMIFYGIFAHSEGLGNVVPQALNETQTMSASVGWFAVVALFFKAFSLGGGTYTGIESVSNSVQNLAEPKVRTGKATMICTAASLSLMAAGIILLYLLWDVERVPGQTLNATTFSAITENWYIGETQVGKYVVLVMMMLAAGLLFVAANTGFLSGPGILANMAIDRWMPHQFSALSSRLVTKNGIFIMGAAAIGALWITGGKVGLLVVLYSINVFLSYTLSLSGLVRHRWKTRKEAGYRKIVVPFFAVLITSSILISTIIEKFTHGGWITVVVTGLVIFIGWQIKSHYNRVRARSHEIDAELGDVLNRENKVVEEPKLVAERPTAVFFISASGSSGMHTFLWVQRLFPKLFHNFIFVSVGEIDAEEMGNQKQWDVMRKDTREVLKKYVSYCQSRGMPSAYYLGYGTDVVAKLTELSEVIAKDFPRSVFFATKLFFDKENFLTQILHNQTAYILQRKLHSAGRTMIIMPMKI